MNLKTMSAAALAVVLAAGLSACGGSEAEPKTATVTVTASPEPAPEPAPEPEPETQAPTLTKRALFLEVVYDEYPYMRGSDKDLVSYAKSVCTLFDAGGTWDDVITIIVENSNDDEDAAEFIGFVAGAGVAVFCPEYSDELEAAADSGGTV